MRKKKETIRRKEEFPDLPMTDAMETETEQRHEETAGERATEELGPGFDAPGEENEIPISADGPPAGDSLEPPVTPAKGIATTSEPRRPGGRKRSKHPAQWATKGDRPAAHSSKKI